MGTGPVTQAASLAPGPPQGATGAAWTEQVLKGSSTAPQVRAQLEDVFLKSLDRSPEARSPEEPMTEHTVTQTEDPVTPMRDAASQSPAPQAPVPHTACPPTRSVWKSVCRMVRRKTKSKSRSQAQESPSPSAISPEDVDTDAASRYLTHKVSYNQNKLLWNALQSVTSVTFMLLTALVLWLKETPNDGTGLKGLEVKTTVNCHCPLDNGRSMTVDSTHKEKEPSPEKTADAKPEKHDAVPMANLHDPQVMHTVAKAYVTAQVLWWAPYALSGLGGLWGAMTVKTLLVV